MEHPIVAGINVPAGAAAQTRHGAQVLRWCSVAARLRGAATGL